MNSSRESAAREHASTLEIEDANSNGTRYKCGCKIWKQFGGPWSITQCSTHAARAREVQELVNALKAATRCPTCDGTGKMTVECMACLSGEPGARCTCSEDTCAQCDGKGWATADGTGEELVAAALAPFAAKGETE